MLIAEKTLYQGVHGGVLGDSGHGNKRRIVDKGSHLSEKTPPRKIWQLQNEYNGEIGTHYWWQFVRNRIINLSVFHPSILSIYLCLHMYNGSKHHLFLRDDLYVALVCNNLSQVIN